MIKPETLAVYGECSMQDHLYFLDKSPSLLIFLKERPPKGRTRLSKEMSTGKSRASASLLYPRHCYTSQFIASLHYMANGSKLPGTRVLQSAVTRRQHQASVSQAITGLDLTTFWPHLRL